MEEALNTLDEEKALCEVLNIQNVEEIPGYMPSQYQGVLKKVIGGYIEQIGELPFSKLRILKDTKDLESYELILESTEATQYLKARQHMDKKREIFNKTSELENVTDESKLKIKEFFEKYQDVYFSPNYEGTFWDKLDNVLEQLFNFNTVKYSFNICDSKNVEIYKEVLSEMVKEGFEPLNQAKDKIAQFNSRNISMNELVKQALQARHKEK